MSFSPNLCKEIWDNFCKRRYRIYTGEYPGEIQQAAIDILSSDMPPDIILDKFGVLIGEYEYKNKLNVISKTEG